MAPKIATKEPDAALLAHGVTGYGRRALDDDYRLSVLWQIARPLVAGGEQYPGVDLVEQSGTYLSGRRRSPVSRSARLTTGNERVKRRPPGDMME
jgi:hypothetical protein